MLDSRKEQFISELMVQGKSKKQSKQEVSMSIDRLVYYAGWSDKFQQIFSRVNPVSTPHYNFSTPEPSGVVSIIAPKDSYLCFMRTEMDYLIMGNYLLDKKEQKSLKGDSDWQTEFELD